MVSRSWVIWMPACSWGGWGSIRVDSTQGFTLHAQNDGRLNTPGRGQTAEGLNGRRTWISVGSMISSCALCCVHGRMCTIGTVRQGSAQDRGLWSMQQRR